jgi:parallel beta-helix repeat protein
LRLLVAALAIAVTCAVVLAARDFPTKAGTPRPVAAATAAAALKPSPACTRYASTAGNDRAAGTATHPLATVQRLVNTLRPGQTGCLAAGEYTQDVTIRRGGASGAPITLRSAPGAQATLRGRLWLAAGADWVTVTRLTLDGQNDNFLPSPTVDSDHATFTYVAVTNDHMGGHHDGDGICFNLGDGSGQYGIAHDTLIAHSRIYACGASDNHNHGIYVDGADHTSIVDNWIYDNGDRGIQLYPDAQNSVIEHNIIAGNGEGVIFSGDTTQASSNNLVEYNTIVGSTIRHNVEYWWPGPVGTGNVVTHNCIYGGHEGNVLLPGVGYTATANLTVAPAFTSASQPSAIKPGTACAAWAPQP